MWKQRCNIFPEAVLKRSTSYKKARISLVPLTKPPSSRYETLFNLIFSSVVNLKLFFAQIVKIFSRPDFVDSEIAIWGLTSLTNFYKRVYLLFKKRHVSHCQTKISFVQITHLKFKFVTPNNIKSYY